MAIRRPPTTFSDTISTADIADDAITGGKLANDIAISTTGNIATTGSGTLTSAGAFTASGGIANSGTITAGTLGSSVVIPTSLSACVKLYHNAFSGVTSASIDGYYDDTKYAYYELHLKNVRKASSSGTEEFFMRANVGGSAHVQNDYWNCGNSNANGPSGAVFTADRADNDQANICHMDTTWHIPNSGNTTGSASYHMRITEPQNTARLKNVYWVHTASRHGSSGDYRAIVGHMMCNIATSSALTGFTFLCGSGGAFECTASLYGFRL